MTERHAPSRHRRLKEVAEWHPIQGSPEKVRTGGAVSATIVETYGFVSSGEPEGC